MMIQHTHCYSFQELKDLKMKADQIKRLMERGYRVKVLSFISLNYFLIIDFLNFLFLLMGFKEFPLNYHFFLLLFWGGWGGGWLFGKVSRAQEVI
jgi:hypothetical protein